ncbi:MAG: three-Cys-motif partner protein TcmP [Spirochaetaceae bacterium]|nr:three-Cys-motif partner protein TcmP [Spirochaetaceae bacterium]
MSKYDNNIITNAAPHTVKKFELIETYVDEWARKILGFPESKGVIYIDCMSNSGEYYDEQNNVIEGTAIRVAKRLNEIIVNYENKKAILIFNDLNKNRVEHLENKINELKLKNIDITYHSEDCNSFLQGLNSNGWKEYNTLLLYDPYRASINWEAIKPFLNRWGEVIINHMVYDTPRGVTQAKKRNVIERYEETYQRDLASLIETDKSELDRIIVSIIKNNLQRTDSQYFISLAPFYNRTNGKMYSLIHCTSNIQGIKLYKRVTWKIFGDKSSLKKNHGVPNAPCLDFGAEFELENIPDAECYTISDIAKYIYEIYKTRGTISLREIYADLDSHPIFPSDGYKNEIKSALKRFGVQIMKDSIEFP